MFKIETERLILRPFTLDDAEEYFKIISDKDVIKYVPYSSALKLETTMEHLKTYSVGDFVRDYYICITLKDSGKIIGAIIAVSVSQVMLDVSYFIGADYRNKGYCTEAMHALINYLYQHNQPAGWRLCFTIEDENTSSISVVKKCNAKKHRELAKACIYISKLDGIAELL